MYEVRSGENPEPEAAKVVSKAALHRHKAKDKVRPPVRAVLPTAALNVADVPLFSNRFGSIRLRSSPQRFASTGR